MNDIGDTMKKQRAEFVCEGFVLNSKNDSILFIQRTKPPMAGWWLPPGGHISNNEGEDPIDGVMREVKDETGIDVDVIDLKKDMPLVLDERTIRIPMPHHIQIEDIDPKHNHIDFIYLCKAKYDGPLKGEGGKDVRWLTYSDIVRFKMPGNVRELARNILSKKIKLPMEE